MVKEEMGIVGVILFYCVLYIPIIIGIILAIKTNRLRKEAEWISFVKHLIGKK